MLNMHGNKPALAAAIVTLGSICASFAWALDISALDLPAPATDADFLATTPAEVALGQLLFYDPVLSGNDNISCSTCHHPKFGTSDGLSLGMGEGGVGLGPARVFDPANVPEDRVPRNAPALYNLGALEYTTMFHDGRVEMVDGQLHVPIEDPFFEQVNGILATQAAFPVLSPDEMAGHVNENPISKAVRKGRFSGEGGAWDLIASKVAALPEYQTLFVAAYPDIATREIRFADISNAIASFIAVEFRADNSPFDAVLRGDDTPLDPLAAAGMALFYGDAGCVECHSGTFQTDHKFHAMGQPQFGPGKTLPFEQGVRDEGRFRVTGKARDLYAFRTPSLRNVTLTAPYGHTGAYADLWEFVTAHSLPRAAFGAWSPEMAVLPAMDVEDWETWNDAREGAAITDAIAVDDLRLSADDIDALVAFLGILTDDTPHLGVPDVVPSGLPFEK
ncbi:cytochrome-c peroxidase [Celeribacter sp.]|uniref:cytochrome-c peroxidase n=1 Tax=Celeribacter sp. TaxID=1890673 RepID=UPI003A956437